MQQLKFYKYASWVLLFLNLSMIAFFILTKPNPPNERGSLQQRAIDLMKMDEQQHDIFVQSAKQHHQQMEAINKQQRELLKPYFYSLIDSMKTTNFDVTLNEVQQLERKKIEATYQHFKEIKSILRKEQLAGFEEFMNDAVEKILIESKKRPNPSKDF